jgi:hypothetical protein
MLGIYDVKLSKPSEAADFRHSPGIDGNLPTILSTEPVHDRIGKCVLLRRAPRAPNPAA